jgi:hypothetical protein
MSRRVVKSPFTKEERQGVFMTIEESRKRRRNKLTRRNPYHDIEITEQEFKNELRIGMEREQQHMSCGCEFCQQEIKKFSDDPEDYLEERWQDYLERKNYKPSEEELERRKAKLEEYRKKGWLV